MFHCKSRLRNQENDEQGNGEIFAKYSLTTITTTCKQLVMTRTHNDGTYTDKVYVTKFIDEGKY